MGPFICSTCGNEYSRAHDLKRHLHQKHSDEKLSDSESSANDTSNDDEDEDCVFAEMVAKIRKINYPKLNAKYQKYADEDMTTKEATHKAWTKMVDEDKRGFLKLYGNLLKEMNLLKDGVLHQIIKKSIEKVMKRDNIEFDKAVRYVLEKKSYLFDEFFDFKVETDTDEDEDSAETDGEDEKE